MSFPLRLFGLVLVTSLFSTSVLAVTFTVKNNCNYIVWGAAVPGGGQQLNPGGTWTFYVPPGQTGGRVWGRKGCTSNGPNQLSCTTGDCGGVLRCTGYSAPPNTLAEYSLNQYAGRDFFDISLVDGYNLPMSFTPVSNGCNSGPTCPAQLINSCPGQLRAQGACQNPCTIYQSDQYCNHPSQLSMYFKNACPTAYSYPRDDPTSTFTCPGNTNYLVTFCP
ncbi:protein P21-like [Silene latifolia]|uniref:protein P21-like n=1 Tax=Silene latifolia TaxID=37657 RepID=UPI003D77F6AA